MADGSESRPYLSARRTGGSACLQYGASTTTKNTTDCTETILRIPCTPCSAGQQSGRRLRSSFRRNRRSWPATPCGADCAGSSPPSPAATPPTALRAKQSTSVTGLREAHRIRAHDHRCRCNPPSRATSAQQKGRARGPALGNRYCRSAQALAALATRAARACSTTTAKPASSRTARSDRTLRSSSMLAAFRPSMKRL